MPRGRAKNIAADQGDGFSQPSAPTKRRKKSRASPGTPDMIPPQMGGGNYGGPMMGPGNPMDDPRMYQNSMPYSPNSMGPDMGMYNMGPGMGPGGPRGGPMPGNQNPYQYQGMPGGPMQGPMGPGPGPHMPHRMPQPNQMPPSSMGNGKTYHMSQSMVFNHSNPNAPPIYPCGICHKEVHDNDQAIMCESGCNFWYHRSCTGLTEAAFVMLTQEPYAEWACDGCLATRSIPLVKIKS